eukprot:5809397-Amphidinium_carterae.1
MEGVGFWVSESYPTQKSDRLTPTARAPAVLGGQRWWMCSRANIAQQVQGQEPLSRNGRSS